jgi:Fe-S-cluster-containing hydrogenase component 2
MTDLYGKVINHLDTNFIGVRDCEEMREILKICLTEKEAGLVLALGHIPVVHGARYAAAKTGLSPDRAGRLLDDLADRGFIARAVLMGRKGYGLLPIMPGFHELTFMKPSSYPEAKDELREQWARYKKKYLVHEMGDYPTSTMRVIPVNTAIEVQNQVFSFEDVERLIDSAGWMALGRCSCRDIMRGCDLPMEVCMIFPPTGRWMVDEGFARRVDANEAKRALYVADEAGLVHCAMNCRHGVQILCNCCGCCCTALKGVVAHQRAYSVSVSSVEARIDPGRCAGCGDCVDRCWTDAVVEDRDHFRVAADRCLGCGLCVSACTNGACGLVRRPSDRRPPAPPTTPLSLWYRMTSERGKTQAVVKALLSEIP